MARVQLHENDWRYWSSCAAKDIVSTLEYDWVDWWYEYSCQLSDFESKSQSNFQDWELGKLCEVVKSWCKP